MITILDSGNNPVITLEQSTVNINLTQEEIDITFVELGVQGLKGAKGETGIGVEYNWQGTSLGLKRENILTYDYVNLIGPKGEPLEFELLTEQQKLELRGDVGDTSTNYTNLFNCVLLS